MKQNDEVEDEADRRRTKLKGEVEDEVAGTANDETEVFGPIQRKEKGCRVPVASR